MYEITGTLHIKGETQQVTDKFRKREIVIKTDNQYEPFVKFEFKQGGCDMVEDFSIGTTVKVGFYVGGREWTKNGVTNYFTTLTGANIEKIAVEEPVQQEAVSAPAYSAHPKAPLPVEDDLPF